MKLFFYDVNGDVVDRVDVTDGVDASRFVVTEEIPRYTPKDGFYGNLVVRDNKLEWDYIPIEPDGFISGEELINIIGGVL